MALPDFIIIGTMKGGTTSLYNTLATHPNIGVSKIKETNYFSQEYKNKSLDWYESLFSSSKPVNGEASPSYTKLHEYPGTVERIYKCLPNARLIFIYRDPIERIKSHLVHNIYHGRLSPKDITKSLCEENHYTLTSSYYYQIEKYLKFFKKDQILFLRTEDLNKSPNKVLDRICDHIKIDRFNFDSQNFHSHKSLEKNYIIHKKWAQRKMPKPLYNLYGTFFKMLNINVRKPIFDKHTIGVVESKIVSDYEKFQKLIS